MGTAERHEAPGTGVVAHMTARRGAEAPDRDIRVGGLTVPDGDLTTEASEGETGARGAQAYEGASRSPEPEASQERPHYRPLWVEEPAKRRRLPDPVRTAAVRAVLIMAVTLIQAMVAFLCTLAGSWLAFPMVLSSIASTVVATWSVLDVWVTRQVWSQRNGVVSTPSSTARALRRERRQARRQARAAERAQERIRRRGGAGQLSHP
ncbi:hypothetical protein I2W78_34520 [Streptomyces spinoverrucosus]|uniref:hypothetical protein n=1 Tax=Streptomyces spinoverrucosus TaxID=284043 RepID=UPI0018C3FFF8|nr:hypothetical protein [Streptomyces spinoverrucosus]MBG0856836.1 hypothetical protein [Streptomyces spinoverrucosus]